MRREGRTNRGYARRVPEYLRLGVLRGTRTWSRAVQPFRGLGIAVWSEIRDVLEALESTGNPMDKPYLRLEVTSHFCSVTSSYSFPAGVSNRYLLSPC